MRSWEPCNLVEDLGKETSGSWQPIKGQSRQKKRGKSQERHLEESVGSILPQEGKTSEAAQPEAGNAPLGWHCCWVEEEGQG